MTFDSEAAERARMSRDELLQAVNERIERDAIFLPLDPDLRKEVLARLVLDILYQRYKQEERLAAELG